MGLSGTGTGKAPRPVRVTSPHAPPPCCSSLTHSYALACACTCNLLLLSRPCRTIDFYGEGMPYTPHPQRTKLPTRGSSAPVTKQATYMELPTCAAFADAFLTMYKAVR